MSQTTVNFNESSTTFFKLTL